MTVLSDFCCLVSFPIKYSDQIKHNITQYIIDILGDKEIEYNIFTNFFQVVDTTEGRIQFCLFEESVKFTYISDLIDNFLNFLDTIKNELEINYEAKELCTEYLSIGEHDYNRSSDEEALDELYYTCQLGGVPEVTDITLLTWIKD